MHGGWKGIVGRLAHVDVVVRVHGPLGALLTAGQLDGTVGNDLVAVHVGLRATAGLPDHQRKILVELAFDYLVRSLLDDSRLLRRQQPQRLVCDSRRLFQYSESANHLAREAVAADLEVDERTGRLRSVVAIRRYAQIAHAVGLDAVVHDLAPSGGGTWLKSL